LDVDVVTTGLQEVLKNWDLHLRSFAEQVNVDKFNKAVQHLKQLLDLRTSFITAPSEVKEFRFFDAYFILTLIMLFYFFFLL
jgi:hypothetical protein